MSKTFLFNPYTGTPRHPSDIASDPAGLLIVDDGEPLRAQQEQISEWMPIEAPPNESGLYLVLIGNQRHIAQYNRNTMTQWWRPYGIPAPLATNPTHWMPLPPAPQGDKTP